MGHQNIRKSIVITSIFHPSEAVKAFAEMEDYQLIVVGDKKTPENWHCSNVDFFSVDMQDHSDYALAKVLPYNHYCRKMLGYLRAISQGADMIIDTDDDNIPKSNWDFPAFDGIYECTEADKGFINIYQRFSDQKIWPRGLPLQLIGTDFDLKKPLNKEACKVGIWQGLADEDPDVDAIYRLTSDSPCFFIDRDPVVLKNGTLCPFNTQNTIIKKELFPLLYLPSYVTFRFTDILRGLVAQPIMWLHDFSLGFTGATVVQKRNPHDYMQDFLSEIPMYQHTESVIETVSAAISGNESIASNLFLAYAALNKKNIVNDMEMKILEAWLEDLKTT
jgi:hypothetical protein